MIHFFLILITEGLGVFMEVTPYSLFVRFYTNDGIVF